MSLPEPFQQRMQTLLGNEAEQLFEALAREAVTGLRVNTLKLSTQMFINIWESKLSNQKLRIKDFSSTPISYLLSPISWCPTGFIIPSDTGAGKHPFHGAGLYYLQEPSAMAVAEALAPQPHELILDLAAAPGGKSTHIAALTNNQSILVANEIDKGRTKALLENLERIGSTKSVITNEDIAKLAKQWGAIFDRVLLDAPCSGEGMFRKSAEALELWSERNVLGCAKRQANLIEDAGKLVKVGGYLVYSTCTFAPEENERVIATFLKQHSEFELCDIALAGVSPGRADWVGAELYRADLAKTIRLFPHQVSGEGHFVAKLQKTSGESSHLKTAAFHPVPKDIEKKWLEFCRATFTKQPFADMQLTMFGDRLFAVPEGVPQVRGLKALRTGVWLGVLEGSGQKARFEPSHSLALAMQPELTEGLELNGEEVPRYLQGHELESSGEDGWLPLKLSGFALGWGKRRKGIIKNAYPKSLRH
ncbi:MAG: RsmB/NOP family class I SAM-dependent RNA methyltransferase [Trueperaceae bacterium]